MHIFGSDRHNETKKKTSALTDSMIACDAVFSEQKVMLRSGKVVECSHASCRTY